MIASLTSRNTSERGFTLLELLVVIGIIAIITAIAVPAFINQRKKSIDAQTQADVKNVATQVFHALADIPNANNFVAEEFAPGKYRVKATYWKVDAPSGTNPQEFVDIKLSSGTHIALVTSTPLSASDPNRDPSNGEVAGVFKIYAYNPAGKSYTSKGSFLLYDSYRGGMLGHANTSSPSPDIAHWISAS